MRFQHASIQHYNTKYNELYSFSYIEMKTAKRTILKELVKLLLFVDTKWNGLSFEKEQNKNRKYPPIWLIYNILPKRL